mmetsp:Transcript_23343/g.31913  ORF Transcript_23343/g.31913 Transcript_23343/m.31913 type:complete len:83 (-) Transcript_23343:600-848(-)
MMSIFLWLEGGSPAHYDNGRTDAGVFAPCVVVVRRMMTCGFEEGTVSVMGSHLERLLSRNNPQSLVLIIGNTQPQKHTTVAG